MKAAALEITCERVQPGLAAIALTGKVMLGANTGAIGELIAALLAQGVLKIVVDLAGVTHIDSTGIGILIAGLGKVTQAGGALALAGASGAVRESFRVTRLDSVFRFYSDRAAALGAI
jgi:anti-sigma B factor antagonist